MGTIHWILVALFVPVVVLYARSPAGPSRSSTALAYARWAAVGIACAVTLAPFVWLLTAIFKDKSIFNEDIFLPPVSHWSTKTLNFSNFAELFRGRQSVDGTVYFWQYVLNSTVYATVSTVLQTFVASLGGYALAKYEFRGRAALTMYMLGSMMVPSVLLLAPLYKMVVDMHMVDSLPGLIVPWIANAYGLFLFRQACVSVPNEMLDAGRIDGCSELTIYFRLVMPLVRPMTAAFCLICFLQNWNAFFAPNVFLHSQKNFTLPIVLTMFVNDYHDTNFGVYLAGTAVAMLPPAVLFLALQREFIRGLTSGAVKG
jgi:ABC-type glycerol-3-phosphate transport system permease component